MTPVILYAEVPDFYAAVECADESSLRGRPLIIGGDPRRRGQVQCASAAAAEAGVAVGMPVLEALERCPRARALRTDMRRYREISVRFRSCLWGEVEALEPAGLAAAYVEVSSASAPALADRLVERVQQELELPLRVGVASAKFLARLAAEACGAQGVRRIASGEEHAFLAPLALDRLPGVGPNTAARLAELGARRVAELLAIDRVLLERELGNHGLRILELAFGREHDPVRAARHPQSLSQEFSFPDGPLDRLVLAERLQQLARELESGLRRQRLRAKRVAVKVRYADRSFENRSQTLDRPLVEAAEIAELAEQLLERTQLGTRPARGLAVALSRLSITRHDERQLELFSGSG